MRHVPSLRSGDCERRRRELEQYTTSLLCYSLLEDACRRELWAATAARACPQLAAAKIAVQADGGGGLVARSHVFTSLARAVSAATPPAAA